MRSIAFADFLIGVGILFVLEGLLFAASPAWMRRAMKSALASPDHVLRAVGIGSAVAGFVPIWGVRRVTPPPHDPPPPAPAPHPNPPLPPAFPAPPPCLFPAHKKPR